MNFLLKHSTWDLLVVLMAVSIPFGPVVPNIVVALLGACWLINAVSGKVRINQATLVPVLILSAYTLFCLLTYFYTDNHGYFWKKASLQIMIVVFALIFFTIGHRMDRKIVRKAALFFGAGTLLLALLCLCKQIWAITTTQESSFDQITGQELSSSVGALHYLSFSLYVSFTLVSGLYYYLKRRRDRLGKLSWFWPMLIFGFLFVFLVLLGSRTSIFITLILCLVLLVSHARQVKNYRPIWVFSIALIGLSLLIGRTDSLKEKWTEIYNYENLDGQGAAYWGGTGMRVLIWDCAWKVIRNNPVMGVGMGDDLDQLTLCYKVYMRNQLLAEGNRFHAHNIFLQAWVRSGIIGLLLLLASFVYSIWHAIRVKNAIYLLFAITFLVSGMTESLLHINAGVLFFAYFSALLFCFKYRPS